MAKPLTVGGLFSGIGGWELGLERAGMEIAWHCEADPFCRRVLEKHWPGVPIYPDVTTLTAGMVEGVDVLCGGFPCQGLSDAGLKLGLLDPRSGLWSEFARLIGEFRPRYVCVENVAALLGRGLGTILGDLAALGYNAEWDCIPASAFGAHHRRDRVWIVAYPDDAHGQGDGGAERASMAQSWVGNDGTLGVVANPQGVGGWTGQPRGPWAEPSGSGERRGGYWPAEPSVGRVAYGVPDRMDRLHALGNALVPQISEWIGRRIVAYEDSLDGMEVER